MQSMGNQPTTPAGSEARFTRRSRNGNSQVDLWPKGTNKKVSMLKRKNFALWQMLAATGAVVVSAGLIMAAVIWFLAPSKKVEPILFSLSDVSLMEMITHSAPKDYAPWTKEIIEVAGKKYDVAPFCTGKECCGENGNDLSSELELKATDELPGDFLRSIGPLLPEAHVAGTAPHKSADKVVKFCQKWLKAGYDTASILQIANLHYFRHTTKAEGSDALLISEKDFEQHLPGFVNLLKQLIYSTNRLYYLDYVRQVNEALEEAKTGKTAPAEAAKTPK
eukprot:GHVT01066037.1.p1 GENE.GHVT01066037.1~~GHVT01066037.1.p1  ORF type:complete len:323 (+),score=56.22 GHVT01066037.1:136-969(+)